MFSKAAKNIIEGNVYQGLEIFGVHGMESFALLVLEKRKGQLEVTAERLSNSLEELRPFITRKKPLFVTINTTQVIKKQLSTEKKENPEVLVIKAFPNLDLDNFYYQILKGEKQSVVSIAKQDHITEYLRLLEKLGWLPFQMALGISSAQNLEGLASDTLVGSNFELGWDNGILSHFGNRTENLASQVHFNGISFQNWHVLGFAQILGFLRQSGQASNLINVNGTLFNSFRNQRWFDLGIQLVLGFFLVLLLSNFLVFNHYYQRNGELKASIELSQNKNGSLKTLQKRVADKENRLERILHSKNSKTSFYLDELGKSIPNSIYLSDIEYQPLLAAVRDDKLIQLKENALKIAGITNDKVQFTVWSDNLEMQKWVRRVEIMDYEYLSKSSANFTLNVILNSDEQEK